MLYGTGDDKNHISDFVLHAALDAVDENIWNSSGMYVLDRWASFFQLVA